MGLGWKMIGLAAICAIVASFILDPMLKNSPAFPVYDVEEDENYYSANLILPPSQGVMLKILSMVARTPIIGHIFVLTTKNLNGFEKVRQFAASLPEDDPSISVTAYWPGVWIPTDAEKIKHEELQAKKEELWSEVGVKRFGRWSSDDYTNAYTTKKESPTSLMRKLIVQIREKQSLIFALESWREDDILNQALESSKRYAEGKQIGPLDGVPIAVKSEFQVKGYNTTFGTSYMHLYDKYNSGIKDGPVVANLRAQGAIIIGVTSMHELGIGVTGNNPTTFTARNPFNPDYHTGGSSSGTAAAVSAGLVPIAIGADGGGSIRIPSALCGVYGLKPNYARVGTPAKSSVYHAGPIANSVKDLALAYKVIAKPIALSTSGRQHHSQFQPKAHLHGISNGVKGIRIGYIPEWNQDSSPEMSLGASNTLKELERQGAILVKLRPIPRSDIQPLVHAITILSEMADFNDAYWFTHSKDLAPDSVLNLALGRSMSARDYLAASRVRTWLMAYTKEAIFEKCDILLTPATAIVAPKIKQGALEYGSSDVTELRKLMQYIILSNTVGFPAGVAPVGFTTLENLPISVQIVSDHWNEHLVVRVMRTLELMLKSVDRPRVLVNI